VSLCSPNWQGSSLPAFAPGRVLLAWVCYSSQILFLGVEFTQVYATRYGKPVRPARGALFLSEQARIREGIPHTKTIEEAFKKKDYDRAA
jgi:membrane protein